MEKARILVIDDEEVIRQLLLQIFEKKGYHVEAAEDGTAALKKISEGFFNLLVIDLKMPKVNGIDILKEIKKINPYIEVIIITGYPTIESAVEAIKIGAFDFICKPFDMHEIASIVDRCLEKQKFTINHIELGELTALFEIGRSITAYTDFDSLLAQILDSALRVIKAKSGSLLLVDEKKKDLCVKAARGTNGEAIRPGGIKPGSDVDGARSFLSIPLMSKYLSSQGDILGIINITEKVSEENFTERDQTLLSILSGQAVVAIENYRLYNQLQDKINVLERMIKELAQTQDQLIQTEKLAAVGQLAFGIAHEIRNPLGIILEGVEFVQTNMADEDKVAKESIGKIKRSVDRANTIIVDLLKFSRASKVRKEPVNVCGLMDEAVSLIRNQACAGRVEINRDYTQKDIRVKADPNMLRQVFFNLCMNAIDAMSGGGLLSLNAHLLQHGAENENSAVIEIADTGKGIPQDALPKIFNPFFTTKEPGKGTGLGLSIVHLILERHGGTIDVESRVNEGTKFTIKLPVEGGSHGDQKEDTLD